MMHLQTTSSHVWFLFAPEMALMIVFVGLFWANVKKQAPSIKKQITVAFWGALTSFFLALSLYSHTTTLLGGSYQLSPFAWLLKAFFALSLGIILIMAREHALRHDERAGNFILLLLLSTMGALFLASANDLITLFITLEWVTVSVYAMLGMYHEDRLTLESATKYLVIGTLSSGFLLYGISLLYGASGGLTIVLVAHALASEPRVAMAGVAIILIAVGIGFKMAFFPFQFWAPDVYEGAPTPVTAYLSIVSKAVGIVFLMKIMPIMLVIGRHFDWTLTAAILSAATMIYGNLGALGQQNMKRVFAYSSISHAGYLLMAVATASSVGMEAAIFYILAYGLSNLTAFLAIVVANEKLGSGQIASYTGLSKRAPLVAGCFFVALISLAGIPPLIGFFGKFYALRAAIDRGFIWLAVLGAINVIVSLFYYLRIVNIMYAKESTSNQEIQIPRLVQSALVLLAISIVIFGAFPTPMIRLAQTAVIRLI